jgi:tRNA(adenine34) deaminase
MSLRFTNDSVNYDLVDEKFLVNPVSGLYLRIHQAHKRVYESEPNMGDSDFMWFVNEDGQAANGEFTVSPVDGDEDVPVNRAAALIEEALNASKKCGCEAGCEGCACEGCDCPKPSPVEPTPVEPTPVEPTPVEPTPVEPTPVEEPTEA